MVRKKRDPAPPPGSGATPDSGATHVEEKKIVVPPKKRRFADQVQPTENGHNEVPCSREVIVAYRLNLLPCEIAKCRRNSRFNPHCKHGLGEKNWLNPKPSASKKKDASEEQLLLEGLGIKPEGSFAGLKNLGATCYANCPIQVLNNIPFFKWRLFEWIPEEDPNEDANALNDPSNTATMPKSVVGNFILVLSLLSFSDRAFVDPSMFIDRIGLDTNVQQDCQEFASLLLHRLESDLARQSNPRIRNLCQDLFRGATVTITQCGSCSTVSPGRRENFYSLLINPADGIEKKGKKAEPPKTITECLDKSLLPQVLDGENQYFCGTCKGKRDATRNTEIASLPPFLFFQVVRFSFNRSKGSINKLKDSVEFSNELDLSKYVNEATGTYEYSLYAVLHHKGREANSGHYIAHIFQAETSDWVKFNDQQVSTQKYPDFNDGAAKGKKGTEVHASSNTYLILYARKGAVEGGDPSLLASPPWVRKYLDADAAVLRVGRELREKEEAKNEAERGRKAKIIADAYAQEQSDDWLFVPTTWLSKWLGNAKPEKVSDMKTLLCPHGCLEPSQISMVKCVPKVMADEICSGREGFIPLGRGNLCQPCALNMMKSTKCKETLQMDIARVSELVKTGGRLAAGQDEESFWVGKSSWKKWQKIAMASVDKPGENGVSNGVTSDKENGDGVDKHDEDGGFNDDAVCPHGGLIPDEKNRKLVSKAVWDIVHTYFPHCHVFPGDTAECLECIQEGKNKEESVSAQKIIAAELKKRMGVYLSSRKKNIITGRVLLIPLQVIKNLQAFLKHPDKASYDPTVDYSSVICSHDKLRVDPNVEGERDDVFFVANWEDLPAFETVFTFPRYVTATPPDGWIGGVIKDWIIEPEICEECIAVRRVAEEAARYEYESTTIYVQKLELAEKILTILDEDLDEEGNVLLDLNRFANGEPRWESQSNQLAMLMSLTDPDQSDLRRSGRSKKARREKELSASSTETLGEFKRKICVITSVPTSEQKILLGSRRLMNDHETLGALKVPPKAHLIVAHHENLFADIDSVNLPPDERPVETGFQGTRLVSSP